MHFSNLCHGKWILAILERHLHCDVLTNDKMYYLNRFTPELSVCLEKLVKPTCRSVNFLPTIASLKIA